MTFSEAENYLYSLANIPRKEFMTDPKGCSEYLARLQFFLDILGNPEKGISPPYLPGHKKQVGKGLYGKTTQH